MAEKLMVALHLERIGCLTRRHSPVPKPQGDEVILKVTHCALCRTDAKMWQKGHRDLILPRIPGHEICGVKEKNEERFTVWPGRACGRCMDCLGGTENLCRHMRITGFHLDGGLAEYVAVPESSLIAVPDELPGDLACLAEPLACTFNALEQARFKEGDGVLIYGAGPVGLLMALAVRARGGHPFVRETDLEKRTRTEDFRRKIGIQWHRDGAGFDFNVVINAAPATDTLLSGLPALRDAGCFCLFSGLTDNQSVPAAVINEIHYRQLRLVGAYGCTRMQMRTALKTLLDYPNEVKLLIEKHIELEQVPHVLPKILASQAMRFVVAF